MTLGNLISCMNRSLQTENKVPSIPPGMSTKNSSQQSVTLGTNAGLILWFVLACAMPSSLSPEPPGDGNVLLINSLNSSTCDWFILSLGSDPAGQELTLVRYTAFQIPSRGKLLDFMLKHKQREYLENLCWLFPSVAKAWHLLLSGATDSQLSQNSPSRDVWLLGFIHGWQHDLEEEGRKWSQEAKGILLFKEAWDESSFSQKCGLLPKASAGPHHLFQLGVLCPQLHCSGQPASNARNSLSWEQT